MPCAGRAAVHNQVSRDLHISNRDDSITWGRSAHLGPGRRSPIEQASILASPNPLAVPAQPLPQTNVRSPFQQFKDLIVVRPATGRISRYELRNMGVRSLLRSRATNGGRQLSAGLLGTRVPLCQCALRSVSPLTLATSTRESLNGYRRKPLPRQELVRARLEAG